MAELIIDSKFRRETSNFKVNFDMSSVDLASQAPVLIKYIEKNLKPEELLGVIASVPVLGAAAICSIADVAVNAEDGTYTLTLSAPIAPALYYAPSTGALSLNGPYVEVEFTTIIDNVSVNIANAAVKIADFSGIPAAGAEGILTVDGTNYRISFESAPNNAGVWGVVDEDGNTTFKVAFKTSPAPVECYFTSWDKSGEFPISLKVTKVM